jgi:hypothetical protein
MPATPRHGRRSTPLTPAPSAGFGSPLHTADATFRMLTRGPRPLTVDGRRIGHGLPRRPIRLDELKRLLLRASTPRPARDAAWAVLVRRARGDGPAWVVGAVGVAMPGLRRAAGRLAAGFGGDTADLDAEVLVGFLTALRVCDLDRPGIAARLCWAAYRAGLRARYAEAAPGVHRPVEDALASASPPLPWEHPDFVLADAVAKGVLAPVDAELIGRTRLEGRELREVAPEVGLGYEAAKKRRQRAEPRLVAAIRAGAVEAAIPPPVSRHAA